MQLNSFIYQCSSCDSVGVIMSKVNDEMLDLIYCPCCGIELNCNEFETNRFVLDSTIENAVESIQNFIELAD